MISELNAHRDLMVQLRACFHQESTSSNDISRMDTLFPQ